MARLRSWRGIVGLLMAAVGIGSAIMLVQSVGEGSGGKANAETIVQRYPILIGTVRGGSHVNELRGGRDVVEGKAGLCTAYGSGYSYVASCRVGCPRNITYTKVDRTVFGTVAVARRIDIVGARGSVVADMFRAPVALACGTEYYVGTLAAGFGVVESVVELGGSGAVVRLGQG